MRIAPLTVSALLFVCGGCGLFSSETEDTFAQPNSLMADEIKSRVEQIPYQHRDELMENLMWLSQTGETTIPALLQGLQHENPKVRSSCAWVLGRLRDRRTIPALQAAAKDSNQTVRFEVARTLVAMGDLQYSPVLIEGLDSTRKEVRYLCHETLKATTGRDFGYDHLSENEQVRRQAVLGWRQWWTDYSGDTFFTQNYRTQYGLQPAVPMGETQDPKPQDPKPQEPRPQDPVPSDPTGREPATDDGVIQVESKPKSTGTTGKPATGTEPKGTGTTGTGTTGKPATGTEPKGTGTTGTGTTGTGTTGTGPKPTGTGTTGTGTTGTGTTGTGTTGTTGTGTTTGTTTGRSN